MAGPRIDRTDWSGGSAWFTVKSTCCLYYKVFDGRPDLAGEGYCTSCPFRDDDWRRARFTSWMEEQAAAG